MDITISNGISPFTEQYAIPFAEAVKRQLERLQTRKRR